VQSADLAFFKKL